MPFRFPSPGRRRQQQPSQQRRQGSGSSSFKLRLLIAGGIILFSLVSYWGSKRSNPITGENQAVGGMTFEQEVAIGLQAVPEMIAQHKGESPDHHGQMVVDDIGVRLLNQLYQKLHSDGRQMPYHFEFHLLADEQLVNAFALPGGQVFITEALYDKLQNEAQLAGVIGHEIGHVLERHGAQRIAKGKLWQGIAGAAGVAGGTESSAQIAQMVGQLTQMTYGRQDELESDRWGIDLMVDIGLDPNEMKEVMNILEEAGGGGNVPEMLSTHPKPANRRKYIDEVIADRFPRGLPPGLSLGRQLHVQRSLFPDNNQPSRRSNRGRVFEAR